MIKRKILAQLNNHLKEKEITLIVGARQTGKTTLIQLLQKDLIKKGEKTIFLDLDNEDHKKYFHTQSDLINFLKLNLGKQRGYVFIDEIQRKENTGLFLKGIYDQNLPYKFIATGSGSLELKEKIHESLAGRKRIFEVMPISLEEFTNYKTAYKYENNQKDFFKYDKNLPEQILNEYMQYGGYPSVVTSETHEDKVKSIQEIYNSYIEKDIIGLLKIQKSEEFNNLLTILSNQNGQMVNYQKLSSIINIDVTTVKKYLWYLQETFITFKIRPYFKNIRKELIKAPVYYFHDLGLRNYALNRLSYFNLITDGGFLFQNLIALELKEKYENLTLNYWRSKGGAEIDFIINAGIETVPIEVKYKDMKDLNITKSIISYINEYNPKKLYIINKSQKDKIQVEKTTIEFLPYYALFYEKLI